MEKQLEKVLRGWQKPNSIFIILRDQDSGDCKKVKEALVVQCKKSGKKNFLVRIACHELETFYLGDLAAVEKVYGCGASQRQDEKKFRNPDLLNKAADELKKITQKKYQKTAGSRQIAPFLSMGNNRSSSFIALIRGLQKIVEQFKGYKK